MKSAKPKREKKYKALPKIRIRGGYITPEILPDHIVTELLTKNVELYIHKGKITLRKSK